MPFELPEGWAWARVKSVTAIGTGATPLKANPAYYKDGTIAWVTSGSASLPIIDRPDGYITELAIKETNCTVYPAGSLVIAMYGEGQTRGRVSQLAIDAATNQACAVLLYIKDGCLQQYIRLCYERNYQGLRDQAKGGNQPNLNQTIIGNFLLPVPPLAEQRRIVAALDRYLALVDTIERDGQELDSLLSRLRSKVLDLAIRGNLSERDPADEPASELLARIHAEKLAMVKRGELRPQDAKSDTIIYTGSDGLRYEKPADDEGEPRCIEDEIPFEIPETWAWARLGTVCLPQAKRCPSGESFNYIDIGNIDNQRHAISGPNWVATKHAPSRASRAVEGTSTVFSMVRPYLRNIAFVGEQYRDSVASTGFYVITPVGLNTNPRWLNFAMLSDYAVNDINSHMKGDNSPSVRQEDVSGLLLPVPPLSEQSRIVKHVDVISQLVTNL